MYKSNYQNKKGYVWMLNYFDQKTRKKYTFRIIPGKNTNLPPDLEKNGYKDMLIPIPDPISKNVTTAPVKEEIKIEPITTEKKEEKKIKLPEPIKEVEEPEVEEIEHIIDQDIKEETKEMINEEDLGDKIWNMYYKEKKNYRMISEELNLDTNSIRSIMKELRKKNK